MVLKIIYGKTLQAFKMWLQYIAYFVCKAADEQALLEADETMCTIWG